LCTNALHYVDLRDHLFKYPFEMLCYRESTWTRWLNASNNLNRLRLPDFAQLFEDRFEDRFEDVGIETGTHLREEFRRTRDRIRSEFLTGNEDIDAAAGIRVAARGVRGPNRSADSVP
jgi:hypothetical protein